jgi:uncharacterized membrane protein
MSISTLVAECRSALRFTRLDVATIAFVVAAAVMGWGLALAHGRPYALAAVVVGLGAVISRSRPLLAGSLIGSGATWLRLSYLGIGYSTQIDVTREAAERAFQGASPYGFLIPSATAPPEPFVYGPLSLPLAQPGVVVELLAAVGVTALLIATRSWLTLGAYSSAPFAIFLTTTGVNDYSPGLLIAAGLVLARSRPVVGAVLLATAAAIKPYAIAWFLPLMGYGGWPATAALATTTVVLWSPVLLWDPTTLIRSVQLHGALQREGANAIDIPAVRWLAIPLSAAGLVARAWEPMVLLGSLAFIAYLFFAAWASLSYWVAVGPAAGIALEQIGRSSTRMRLTATSPSNAAALGA